MVRDVAKCGALEPHTGYDCEREAGHELPHLAFIDAHDEAGPLPEREWSVEACAVELERNARCLFPHGHDGPHGTDTVTEGNKNSHLQRTTPYLDETRRYVERCQAHNTRLVARHEVEIAHARKQSHVDGFQAGWHAALQRVWEGDRVSELRQLAPQPTETRWQPIETAPKGLDVLVCEGRFRVRVAFWGPAGWRTMPGDIGIHPTHWQPLPTPVVAHSSTRNNDVAHTEKHSPTVDQSKWFVIHKRPSKPVEWLLGFDTDESAYEYYAKMRDEHTYLCEVQRWFLEAETHTSTARR